MSNCEDINFVDIKSIENDIEEIQFPEELNKILAENTNVLISFYSTWCSPCKFLDMEIRKLKNLPILKIVKINVQNSPELCSKFNIENLPTLFLYINSVQQTTLIGYSTNHVQTILGFICPECAY